MINCKKAELLIQVLIDSRVSPAERDELDLHLETCRACSQLLSQMRAVSQTAAAWAMPPERSVSSDFTANVLAAIVVDENRSEIRASVAHFIGASALIAASVAALYFSAPHLQVSSFEMPASGSLPLPQSARDVSDSLLGVLSQSFQSLSEIRGATPFNWPILWTGSLAALGFVMHLAFANRVRRIQA